MMVWRQLLNSIVGDLFPFLVLCAGRDFDRNVTIECFNNHVGAEYGLANVQVKISMDVRTFSLKVGVIPYLNMDYQVTVRTTLSSMTLLCYSKIYAIVDTFGNVNCFFSCTMTRSSSSASDTRISDNLSDTIAVATDLLNHEGTLANGLEALTSTATAC